jgi:colicin import membrane protein
MARTMAFGVSARRDPHVVRMVGLSAVLHGTVLFVLLVLLPLLKPAPLPIVAYTVELTDSSSLGGRLAPGRADLPMGPRPGPSGGEAPARDGAPAKPEPAPKPEAVARAEPAPKPEPPKPVEPPKPIEPAVKLPSPEKPLPKPEPKPEAKKPPEPKPEPKPSVEAKKPEPPKPAPDARAPETAKSADAPPKPSAPAKSAETKPADAKPAAEAKPAGKPGGKSEGTPDGGDAYAAAAEKWRAKGATGGGGGLGGTDTSPGPMGTPGYGGGGGGQVVGFEFLAYQQRVVNTVKGVWTNAAIRPGLVAKVRFDIAPNGDVSGIRLEQPSGDTAFDGSVLRAVQRANPLPPPPARYVNEFREFLIEFHSEEGGQLPG